MSKRVVGAAPGGAGTDWTRLIVTEGPDATQARPDVQLNLLRLDAFVIRGRSEVYVVRQSSLLQCAMRREPLCTHALAAVIWHEMAHIAGADEREARRREEAQWTAFIRDQQVDAGATLQFLKLVNRPDDYLLVTR